MIVARRSTILPRNAERFQLNPLRIQHAEDVMVRDEQQFCGGAKLVVWIGKQARVNMSMGANQRQICHQII